MRRIPKVAAFVTRGFDHTAELLLLRHPLAGVQLPAGTVELGETPEAAVLREVREEAGLSEVVVAASLGRLEEELPPDRRAILRLTKIFDQPSFDASSEGYALRRGSPVTVIGTAGDFAEITAELLDARHDPPRRVPGVRGFVRRSLLATHYDRYLYHLTLTAPTPAEWEACSDGHVFRLFWSPLRPAPAVHPAQAPWLAAAYEELLRRTAAPSGDG